MCLGGSVCSYKNRSIIFFIACSAEKSSGEHSLVLINKMELLETDVPLTFTVCYINEIEKFAYTVITVETA